MKPTSLLLLTACLLASGCGPKPTEEAPVTPPPPAANVAEPTSAPAPSTGEGGTMKVADLPTDHSTDIKVEAEPKSMTVVEHYDAALTGAGWEKYQPTAESKPGQRKWLSMGVKMGPTDVYDAAWFDPKSGKKALLSVFHTAEAPKVQSGTFEVWEKDDPKAPF